MGFRNLKIFNNALLAKQGWRICENPDSLVAKTLKAKYFRNSDFLSSKLGSNPSFTWSSIWSARHLLAEGIQWRIGWGSNVYVWSQRWIPDYPLFRTPKAVDDMDPNLRVSELINWSDFSWDRDRVSAHLHPNDVDIVCGIPLSSHRQADTMMWGLTNDGIFTVKSAHRLGMNQIENRRPRSNLSRLWNDVWALKVPPKMKNFAWRAMAESLAVKAKLVHKKVVNTSACDRCGEAAETIAHATLFCSDPALLWETSYLRNTIAAMQGDSFLNIALKILQDHGNSGLTDLILFAWAGWNARNLSIMCGKHEQSRNCFGGLKHFVTLYKEAQSIEANIQPPAKLMCEWLPPQYGITKINTDATLRGTYGAGLGAVMRDSEGSIIAAAVRHIPGCGQVDLAEALALLFGLKTAVRMGLSNIWIESDALGVVLRVTNGNNDRSYLGAVVDDIRRELSNFASFNVSFVKKSGNTVDHNCARLIPSSGCEQLYFENFPPNLLCLAELDVK